jgi:hypothetical protein
MKLKFVDKSSLYSLPIVLFILILLQLFMIKYSSISYSAGSMFAFYKVILVLGFNISLIGLVSESSSSLPIDLYLEGEDSILFKHHWMVSVFKIFMIIIGLSCIIIGSYLTPESEPKDKTWVYYLLIGIGSIFSIGMVVQFFITIKNLVSNRKDFIKITATQLSWYDNDQGIVKEILLSDVDNYSKKFEDTDESPELEEIHIHKKDNECEIISLKQMSLIPHQKIIIIELEKSIKPQS